MFLEFHPLDAEQEHGHLSHTLLTHKISACSILLIMNTPEC